MKRHPNPAVTRGPDPAPRRDLPLDSGEAGQAPSGDAGWLDERLQTTPASGMEPVGTTLPERARRGGARGRAKESRRGSY